MSYNEDEEVESGFRMGVDDDEPLEPLDVPPEDLDLDDDPEDKYH